MPDEDKRRLSSYPTDEEFSKDTWVTKDGDRVHITNMSEEQLIHSVNKISRTVVIPHNSPSTSKRWRGKYLPKLMAELDRRRASSRNGRVLEELHGATSPEE